MERQEAQQVLAELMAIGFAKATDCLRYQNDRLELNVDDLSPQQAAAIACVEKTSGGWKVKFYDKLKALELLGNCLGLFGNADQNQGEKSNLLEAILASTGEAIDCNDIPEIQQASAAGHDLVEQTGA